MDQKSIITATFDARATFEAAVRRLEHLGITKEDITILTTQDAREMHFGIVEKSKAAEGAVVGATAGGLVAALYMAVASAGSLAVPGLNLVVAGTLMSALSGLGAGAVAGGFVGALVGLGIPEHEARLYEEKLKGGEILIAVKAEDEDAAVAIRAILESVHAQNVTRAA